MTCSSPSIERGMRQEAEYPTSSRAWMANQPRTVRKKCEVSPDEPDRRWQERKYLEKL